MTHAMTRGMIVTMTAAPTTRSTSSSPSSTRGKKTPPAPVNFIVGPEEFLAERHRNGIVAAARAHSGDQSIPVDTRKCSELNPSEVLELLSPSLFAQDRIVVITGVETAANQTVELLEQAIDVPTEGVVLILMHTGAGRNKKLVQKWSKKKIAVFTADKFKPRDVMTFVEHEFRRHRATVERDVTTTLLNNVGSDLRELASAVSQLVADTTGPITVDDVRKYYSGKAEVSGFDIADMVVSGQESEALALTRRALQLGVPLVLLAAALSGAVSDLAKVVGAGRINARQDAAEFGMPPWRLEKVQRTARRWSPAKVAAAVQIVAELDAAMKGNAVAPEFFIEHAVRDIARLVA